MKLAAKLMIVFLLVVMILTAASGYFAVCREVRIFEHRQQELARQVANSLEQSLTLAWSQQGRDAVLQILQNSALPQPDIRIRWVWFDAAEGDPDCPAASRERLANLRSLQIVSVQIRDETGAGHIHTYCPMEVEPSRRGGLEITGSLQQLDNETRATIYQTLTVILGTGLLCGLLIVLVGVRMVGRPLNQLIDKTRRVGQGDFAGPLHLKRHDELGELAEALNEMCDQLANQRDRIRAEAAARLATLEQLRHADRLKTVGRLAAGIAHELGTPLNVVSGRAGLIASGKLSEEEVRASATTIKSEADRITSTIRRLLDFARRNTPQRTQANLEDVIRQTLDLLRTLAEKRNVKLDLQVDRSPRDAAADHSDEFLTLIDVGQMQQVLTNIVVNAIQAMPDGGQVAVRLQAVRCRPPEMADGGERDFFRISIQDQGSGIDPADLPHIFEPFFTTKDIGQGTGLGLSIAYGIVQEHGGWIDVSSEPGRGSCFSIYLPRDTQSAAARS